MPDDQEPLTAQEVEALCREGRRITDGPLNRTYQVRRAGADLFVRERIVRDEAYGQTFAGERHVPEVLARALNTPRLLTVLSRGEGETFAVFEYVEGTEPDWRDPAVLERLADALSLVHSYTGSGFGDLGGTVSSTSAESHLSGLLDAEIGRLPGHLRDALGLGAGAGVWRAVANFQGEPAVLCHGDIHRQNFIWTRTGDLVVLDWEAVRLRVAASDFNQMRADWLSSEQEATLLAVYLRTTQRDARQFAMQIDVVRLLWHLRTYNFQTLVLHRPAEAHLEHLDAVHRLVGQVA